MSANDGDHVISSGDSASARFLNEPSRRVFRPLGRKDIEIEYRFIAEHFAPMGDVRGNDD
jgi:hypothetical protein